MAKPPKSPAPFPSREKILEFIQNTPGNVGKREIVRAFHLDSEQKRELKKLLRELTLHGSLQKGRGRNYTGPGELPEVTILDIAAIDDDGELIARPVNWNDAKTRPLIIMAPERRGQPALGIGDRVLARLTKIGEHNYKAKTIRRIAAAPPTVLGIFDMIDGSARIRPTDKRARSDFIVQVGDEMHAQPGELVRAEVTSGRRLGLRQAKVIERLDKFAGTKAISLISIHEHGIPDRFSNDTVAAAEAAGPAPLDKRVDLRDLPLVTIDGADARDFDDAVWAEPDPDPENTDGWHMIVAIADVSWYVRPGQPLDREARERGNSVYFPDRVVPMLPEALSNGWCSLVPKEDRPCMAAHLWIDAQGRLKKHVFVRGLIRSAARLTYEQVQAARDGHPDDATDTLTEAVIAPLYGAFDALLTYRNQRQALELELPEKQVVIGEDGSVTAITERERLDSHKLIEEFMITANVAAAETLERLRQPCMYRIHDRPSMEKIQALSEFLDSLGIRFARGQIAKPMQFNGILNQFEDKPEAHMVSQVILRSQAQAEYNPANIGHFGLALRRYAHFTSPIRRYADLVVHRALITGLGLGAGGLGKHDEDFNELGQHLSVAERRAAAAERSAIDRFTADFLADRIGATFGARVNGVTRAGLFVTLLETGADGLVPIRTLPDDYYVHDDQLHTLTGSENGLVFKLGQTLDVTLMEAKPLTGGLILTVAGESSAAGAPARGKAHKPRHMAKGQKRGNKPKKSGRRRR
ncbi:MAG: ribonuclease R [Rhodospirillaceae bacterium]|nr:ribonuclease R [Rhodospirillaceae bacterium]